MPDLLIHDCDILRNEGDRAWVDLHQDIWVDGVRIKDIQPASSMPSPGNLRIVEAGGRLAIPGLMNTHAHVPMTLFRGLAEDVSVEAWFNDYIWPVESNLTPEDVYWGALLGMAEMIEAGVTCVADHYFAMDQVAQAAADAGMRALLAWAVFAHEGEAKLEQTCKFVQRWQGKADGRITAWLGPHAPYTTTPDFLRLCARRAQELGVGIHTHVSETAEQVRLSLEQYGVTPVRMLLDTGILERPAILAHCAYPSDADLEILHGKRAGVAHAPKTYLKLGSGIPDLRRYLNAGIPVGLATDGAASSNTLDILEQLRMMVLSQKNLAGDSTVMPVAKALGIAFQGSAQVLQMGSDLGEVTPGRLADITLIRQDGAHVFPRINPAANLIYSSRAADVDTVICNGQVLLENGQLLTIDKAQVKREVSRRLARLSQRVPGNRIAIYPA
ncbi:MAG: amidohydrolase [Chloroflexi bacterium]|nr:amidohydrolase [Chloroflexota bacterium]